MRRKLEGDYLCPALRGHITYFATSYSKCPDHEGRAAIRLDGNEIIKSGYYDYQQQFWIAEREIIHARTQPAPDQWNQIRRTVLEKGSFDQRNFYSAFHEFDNQAIELSLNSQSPIVRVMAVLDRRVGRRRLKALASQVAEWPDWVQLFYTIRLKAEQIEPGFFKE